MLFVCSRRRCRIGKHASRNRNRTLLCHMSSATIASMAYASTCDYNDRHRLDPLIWYKHRRIGAIRTTGLYLER